MLPDFFVVGAQKCGTTALQNYLSNHPDIYLPESKETKFFVFDERYKQGISYYEETYYSGVKDERAVGEIDPDYMYFPCALDRIRQHINTDKLKVILLLRNPLDRALSHYQMTYRRGREPLPFYEALMAEDSRIQQSQMANEHFSYLARGFYYKQITRLLEVMSIDQLLILMSDDLKQDRENTLRSVFRFLSVDENYLPVNVEESFHVATKPRSMTLVRRVVSGDRIEKNLFRILIPWKKPRHKLRKMILDLNQVKADKPVMSDQARDYMVERYRGDVDALSELLGRDMGHWLA